MLRNAPLRPKPGVRPSGQSRAALSVSALAMKPSRSVPCQSPGRHNYGMLGKADAAKKGCDVLNCLLRSRASPRADLVILTMADEFSPLQSGVPTGKFTLFFRFSFPGTITR